MTDKKAPEPMDSGAPERAVGEAAPTNQRACYAAKTLVAEVLALFPETVWMVENYNGRNVGLRVVVLTDAEDQDKLSDLLALVDSDSRVERVQTFASETIIDFHNRPRTYDLRDSFGLDEAWMVMGEEDYDIGLDLPLDGARLDYGSDSPPVEGGNAAKTSRTKMDGGGA
jgi:hypothetical protein